MTIASEEFATAAPQTPGMFAARLAATGPALLATLRSNGFPRVSPLEAGIYSGRLYLGKMPRSTKSLDLRRDPRCCVHTAKIDKYAEKGDEAMGTGDGGDRGRRPPHVRC